MTATPKDLQDEVGRLREALEDAKEALMDGSGAGVFWRESAVERINKALQSPPESADECLHPRIYTAQDGHRFCDECEAYLGEESPPQACETKIKAPPTKEQL